MVNSVGAFLVWNALKIKAAGFIFAGLLGACFEHSVKDKRAFTLPFLYLATLAGWAALGNFFILMVHN